MAFGFVFFVLAALVIMVPGSGKESTGSVFRVEMPRLSLEVQGGQFDTSKDDPELGHIKNSDLEALGFEAPPPATLDDFYTIEEGMTYKQVEFLIGEPGIIVFKNNFSNPPALIYQWESGNAQIHVMTLDGRVSKTWQRGLR